MHAALPLSFDGTPSLARCRDLGLCVGKVFEFTRKLVRNQDKIQMSHLNIRLIRLIVSKYLTLS